MTTLTQDNVQTQTLLQAPSRLIPEKWYVHLLLWLACFIVGFPLLYAVIVATQTNAEVTSFQFYPGSSFWQNWDIVMNARNFGRSMLNTAFVALMVTAGKTILSLLSGLAFVYFRFPGKWVIFGFVLMTLMMPTEILIIALVRFVSNLGWGDTYWALTVPFLASATGTFLFRQHFANIPAELSEAAQLDGANPLQFLLRVLVPISWNTIGALAVIQFVYVWNFYLWPLLIIKDERMQVVQQALGALRNADSTLTYGPLMLAAVIASIPPVIVFILLQKQFMNGFAITRDK